MSKSKSKNYKIEERKYEDGYHVNNRKPKINKSEERRFERALRTKNIESLIVNDELDDLDSFNEELKDTDANL